MPVDSFDILLLIARPAAGKSEVIDYLKKIDSTERRTRFHLGELDEIDDFPMLWTWFEEDALLDEMGLSRLYTDADGYFLEPHLWNLLIRRIGLEYHKKLREPDYHETYSTLIEFSRGKEHGGYRSAFEHLARSIIERAAILYLRVSWEESLRKNRARFNPARPDSILEHGLSDEKLSHLYRETDWEDVTVGDPAFLVLQGVRVPYVVFENEDDVTTARGKALGTRLEDCLDRLWASYAASRISA